jgi:hypothetical protein
MGEGKGKGKGKREGQREGGGATTIILLPSFPVAGEAVFILPISTAALPRVCIFHSRPWSVCCVVVITSLVLVIMMDASPAAAAAAAELFLSWNPG